MAPRRYVRTYYRFPLNYPVIFGGAPFVGEGVLTNLSLKGCSVMCDREVLCGSDVRVSELLDHQPPALPIALGTIKWVKGHQFGRGVCPSSRWSKGSEIRRLSDELATRRGVKILKSVIITV